MMKIISLLSGRMSLKIIISYSLLLLRLHRRRCWIPSSLCHELFPLFHNVHVHIKVRGENKKKKRKVVERLHFASFAIKLNLSRRLGTLNLVLSRKSIRFVLFQKKELFVCQKRQKEKGREREGKTASVKHTQTHIHTSNKFPRRPKQRSILLLLYMILFLEFLFISNKKCMANRGNDVVEMSSSRRRKNLWNNIKLHVWTETGHEYDFEMNKFLWATRCEVENPHLILS